jgi:two-component sensor histidine kinase
MTKRQAGPHAPKWYRGLRARLTLMLSIAALPIGLIAVFQTNRLAETADKNAELALLALSDQAVQSERLLIQRARGAAEMLGVAAPLLLQNPENCVPFLQNFLDQDQDFSYAAILPLDGVVRCSSIEEVLDFSGYPTWPDLVSDPRPNVVMNPAAPGSKTAVIVVSIPFEMDGTFAGYISISIPQTKLAERDAFADLPVSGLVELFTFNDTGSVLTAENDLSSAEDLLPQGFDFANISTKNAQSFRGISKAGDAYIYTIVPVSDSPLSIMGVWDSNRMADAKLLRSAIPASAFPILMWIASVAVAVVALHTLVIRHINSLRRQMTSFATNRQIPANPLDQSASTELAEIQDRFIDMTDDILREEARLEAMVREQKVMAKEVHHRVKNNLQMIASIMNMQIRNAQHQESIETLERVQDRITALADVHKDLYTAQEDGRINVGALIKRTVQGSVEVGISDTTTIDLSKDIVDVWLYPDQVVPLSLLASEAITNALKHMGHMPGEKPKLHISVQEVDRRCIFEVSNTLGGQPAQTGTGIGSKLIRAFGIKLGAEPVVTSDADTYSLKIDFPIAEFEIESLDY